MSSLKNENSDQEGAIIYFLLDVNEISAYDKRRKNKEHLGVLLSNFISALKKSTQTPLSKRSCVRAKVGGEAFCSRHGFCVKQRNA